MTKREIRCFLSPWRAIAEPDFWRSVLREPATGLYLVFATIHASAIWIIRMVCVPPDVRKSQDG